jgi:dihydrofolate reductase
MGKVFIIGGAQIYEAALKLQEARRVLLTRVMREFECDTFFSLKLDPSNSQWVKKSKEEMDVWVGEDVPAGIQEENDTAYEFEMWEKVEEDESLN